ncbi:Hypothetical predicted protein [Cloeon dipterum]|uniref:Reverse transcriptase domain-containing protein n=1 Tax=Cloeon dipterum TaxID=197152 RepID=A0A8S1E6I6_9INSE|nr:Hypothetical predicted protein [Cloeon dipterum]
MFLCDTPNLVSSSEVIAGVIDHDALLAELRVDSCRPTPLPAMLPNWRRAPWPTLNDRLAEEMQAVLQINNINDAWTAWKTTLVGCVSEYAKGASGPNGVLAVLLKRFAKTLCPSLAHIFNLSLRACDLPADWKCAAVTPIPKDGEKSDLRYYRPISVTSLVGKLLEKQARNQLAGFLDTNKALPDNQHGFRERRSCTTMLLRTLDSWTAATDKNSGGNVHAIFLDWAKAFDKVPHQRLLSKLQHHGIDGTALEWLKISLSAVGSVLGPLLFNVYVSDLPAVVKTNLVQYADDCTIFREVTSQDDVDELQEDLALIDIWCVNNGMQLNAKKCVAMDLSRARQPWLPQYMIGGAVLEYVSTQRLLGVHIARDLHWNHQVDVQRKKAAQTLGFAARNLRGCTQRVKRMAYLTLVKPKLFYGTPAWHPWTKTNTEKMARTQNKALHFIHGRHVPPPEKQNMLSVPAQLAYNDLLFFKKSLCGLTEYNAMARITEGRVHRGDDPLHPRLQQPTARTELGQNAFDYRIVAEWNAAPPAIKDCSAAQFPAV